MCVTKTFTTIVTSNSVYINIPLILNVQNTSTYYMNQRIFVSGINFYSPLYVSWARQGNSYSPFFLNVGKLFCSVLFTFTGLPAVYAVLWFGDLFLNVWHQNSRLSLQWIFGCLVPVFVCCMGCWLVSFYRRALSVVAVSCLLKWCCSMVIPSGRDISLFSVRSSLKALRFLNFCSCPYVLLDPFTKNI